MHKIRLQETFRISVKKLGGSWTATCLEKHSPFFSSKVDAIERAESFLKIKLSEYIIENKGWRYFTSPQEFWDNDDIKIIRIYLAFEKPTRLQLVKLYDIPKLIKRVGEIKEIHLEEIKE